MSKFVDCKTCKNYGNCDYLKKGTVCYGNLYSTSFESKFDCIQGKSVDVELIEDNSDLRLDLIVDKKNIFKIWGQVKDSYDMYIEGVLVNLLKPHYVRGEIEYNLIATTTTDCFGFYQFEIDELEKGLKYRVTVGEN